MSVFDDATEQQVVFMPMFLPVVVFDFVNKAARARGVSPGVLINSIFFEKLKEMAEDDASANGGK